MLSRDGKAAVLSGPTERYVRGVLGDGLEAESVSALNPGKDTVESFRAKSSGVFEALVPL